MVGKSQGGEQKDPYAVLMDGFTIDELKEAVLRSGHPLQAAATEILRSSLTDGSNDFRLQIQE